VEANGRLSQKGSFLRHISYAMTGTGARITPTTSAPLLQKAQTGDCNSHIDVASDWANGEKLVVLKLGGTTFFVRECSIFDYSANRTIIMSAKKVDRRKFMCI
jgi:hypothetical protein